MNALLLAVVMNASILEVDARTGAQLCVGETHWSDYEMCAAQLHIIKARADRFGRTFTSMARQYSRALRNPVRRPWVVHLRDRARPPLHWRNASWERRRPQFAYLKKIARGVLTGDVPNPCPGAFHFGSSHLDGVPDGFERHDCFPDHEQAIYRRSPR